MSIHSLRSAPVALALTLAVAAAPSAALASGFQLVEQNGSGLGNAYSGQAAGVTDASAIFFNPAAMTSIEKRQLVLAASPIGVSTKFTDSGSGRPFLPSTPPLTLPVPLGSAGGNAGGWIPVPNGYFTWQVASKWWLGLGVNAPFGLKTEWDTDWIGRFHAVKSDVHTLNINPSLAVKVNDQFSLGAGASYQRLSAELTQNVAYGGIALAIASSTPPAIRALAVGSILGQLGGPAGLAKEGLGAVKGDDWAWGWNAGALVHVDKARFGVTYRSKVKHDIKGDASFAGAPAFSTAGPLGVVGGAINARFTPGPVSAKIDLPDTFSVAGAYLGDKVELLGDWTWTGWKSIQDLTIVRDGGSPMSSVPLNFQNTWRVGGGLNYRLNDNWKLRFGVAYDKAPVQDQFRTPRLPDENRTWAATGFEWKLNKDSAIDAGYAHLFVKEATSALPNQDTATSAPTGKLVGTYPTHVDLVTLQYRISF